MNKTDFTTWLYQNVRYGRRPIKAVLSKADRDSLIQDCLASQMRLDPESSRPIGQVEVMGVLIEEGDTETPIPYYERRDGDDEGILRE